MNAWETLFAVLALTGLVVLIPLLFWSLVDRRPQGPDVPLAELMEEPTNDVDEDINAPKVERILAALAYTDPTEHEAVDRLLDRLNAAKRRAS